MGPKWIFDNITFDQILNKSFEETKEIANWFNNFNDAKNGFKVENLKGLGPYEVSEWETEQYIILTKKEKLVGIK